MKLASIERIKAVVNHPNADLLDVVTCLGFQAIVKRDQYKVDDLCVFIQPDVVLPDAPWATFYKAKSNRVKAIRLRQVWSMGIVESLSILPERTGFDGDGNEREILPEEGDEVSEILGIVKYEAPEPQDLQAKGGLPFGLPITDEERFNNILELPYGEVVDVTLKRDGKSWTAYAIKKDNEWHTGICGRRLEYKLDCPNDYTKFQFVLSPLLEFAKSQDKSIVLRGELTGQKIQSSKNNPHSKGETVLHIFSVFLPDENTYARKGSEFYFPFVAEKLGLNHVEILEKDVILTPDLIKKYSQDVERINDKPYEGVVVQGDKFSFKILSHYYDSLK
jgi:RNA ligase (TIGR02306 family)